MGIGLIMAIIGCLLAAIASILLLRQKDVASAE
jgi:multisubunit Na+/H+ antiporter MnhG subunit